jgi:hypothetical protein
MQKSKIALAILSALFVSPVGAMECVPMDQILDLSVPVSSVPTEYPVFNPVIFESGVRMKLWTWNFSYAAAEPPTMDNPTVADVSQCGGSTSTKALRTNASSLYGQVTHPGVHQVVFKLCDFVAPGNLSGDVSAPQSFADLTTVSAEQLQGPFGEDVKATAVPAASGSGHELTLSGASVTAFIVGAKAVDIAEVCIVP